MFIYAPLRFVVFIINLNLTQNRHAKMRNDKSILRNIIDGMANALVLYPDSDYIRPDKHGFSRDMANLRGDFNNVARDLRKTTLEHGQQIYNR
ncbi:hypothetical protein [Limnohabitans sp.]